MEDVRYLQEIDILGNVAGMYDSAAKPVTVGEIFARTKSAIKMVYE